MRAIAEAWRCYDQHLMPPDADQAERAQIRRSFYTGMHCLLILLNGIAELPDPLRAEVINDLKEELQVFMATLDSCVEGLV